MNDRKYCCANCRHWEPGDSWRTTPIGMERRIPTAIMAQGTCHVTDRPYGRMNYMKPCRRFECRLYENPGLISRNFQK
nr:MAG TPA: hypothetical protein [Herelleviridae sp.]